MGSFSEQKYNPKKKNELQKPVTIATQNHQFVTDIEWDSTGRYVVTSASAFIHKMENGYTMWNFLGRELWTHKTEGFVVFKWRPRPPAKLSAEQIKHIKQNIGTYAKEFMERDAIRSTQVSAVEQPKIKGLLGKWNDRKAKQKAMIEEQLAYQRSIFAAMDDQDGD